MYVILRVKPFKDDGTRWDKRTKTVLARKPTQHAALTFVCELLRLGTEDRRARYFVRREGDEQSIWARAPWFTRGLAPVFV